MRDGAPLHARVEWFVTRWVSALLRPVDPFATTILKLAASVALLWLVAK